MVRASCVGLLAHVAQCLLLASAGAADIRWATPRLALISVAAVLAAVGVDRYLDVPNPALLCVASAWTAAAVVHHYGIGITATWSGQPVRGAAHVAWDLGFHVPAVLVAWLSTEGLVRSPPTPE